MGKTQKRPVTRSSFAMLMADDQGQSIDGEDEGAMPNWVPVFAPKPGSKTSFPGAGAPNWMTAFPTILHTLWKHTGDTSLISRHWEQLVGYLGWYERKLRKFPSFASNPFRRTASGEISDTQFPGDWCPPPKAQGMYRDPTMNNSVDIASGLGEAECGHTGWNPDHTRYIDPALFTEKNLSSAFSYLHDKQMIAEMGAAINASAASSASVRETCALLRFLYTFVPNLSWPGKKFCLQENSTKTLFLQALEGITAQDKANFRAAFYHTGAAAPHFGGGGAAVQSENAMALLLGILSDDDTQTATDDDDDAGAMVTAANPEHPNQLPDAAAEAIEEEAAAAVDVEEYLLRDIMVTHKNHTTSGIVGLRAMFELLPKLGKADVGLAMLLRRDYPSFGYEVTNSLEPATTIWVRLETEVAHIFRSFLLVSVPSLSWQSIVLRR